VAIAVNIPKLGMAMTEAKIVEWKVKEGEWVEEGDVVLVIETAKVTWDVEAQAPGFLYIIEEPGTLSAIGAVVGVIAESEDELKEIKKLHQEAAAV
jgi:pyruvate dehydrogenase E2 component (dihydrolipoyllysine-residue acetyltransferase)